MNRSKNMDALKKQFAQLKGQGHQQKEISKIIGVSQTTLSAWNKSLPGNHYASIREGMLKRLDELANDATALPLDMYNLTSALLGIENRIDRLTNGG